MWIYLVNFLLVFLFDRSAYDPSTLPVYYVSLLLDSVVLAWTFNGTGGSVLPAWLFHAVGDAPGIWTVSEPVPGLAGTLGEYGYPIGVGVLALALLVARGPGIAAERLPDRLPVGYPLR